MPLTILKVFVICNIAY